MDSSCGSTSAENQISKSTVTPPYGHVSESREKVLAILDKHFVGQLEYILPAKLKIAADCGDCHKGWFWDTETALLFSVNPRVCMFEKFIF